MKKVIITTTQPILGSDVFSVNFSSDTGVKIYTRAKLKCVKALEEANSLNDDLSLKPLPIGDVYIPIDMIASIIVKD